MHYKGRTVGIFGTGQEQTGRISIAGTGTGQACESQRYLGLLMGNGKWFMLFYSDPKDTGELAVSECSKLDAWLFEKESSNLWSGSGLAAFAGLSREARMDRPGATPLTGSIRIKRKRSDDYRVSVDLRNTIGDEAILQGDFVNKLRCKFDLNALWIGPAMVLGIGFAGPNVSVAPPEATRVK